LRGKVNDRIRLTDQDLASLSFLQALEGCLDDEAVEVVFVRVDAVDRECSLDKRRRRVRNFEEQVALRGFILSIQHEVSSCFGDGDLG